MLRWSLYQRKEGRCEAIHLIYLIKCAIALSKDRDQVQLEYLLEKFAMWSVCLNRYGADGSSSRTFSLLLSFRDAQCHIVSFIFSRLALISPSLRPYKCVLTIYIVVNRGFLSVFPGCSMSNCLIHFHFFQSVKANFNHAHLL